MIQKGHKNNNKHGCLLLRIWNNSLDGFIQFPAQGQKGRPVSLARRDCSTVNQSHMAELISLVFVAVSSVVLVSVQNIRKRVSPQAWYNKVCFLLWFTKSRHKLHFPPSFQVLASWHTPIRQVLNQVRLSMNRTPIVKRYRTLSVAYLWESENTINNYFIPLKGVKNGCIVIYLVHRWIQFLKMLVKLETVTSFLVLFFS